ncbi:alpha/beta fold hydrolase [Paenibacillus sp. NPDC093718]|uniref:alpha/beta fold hydrolase n=1 Tax=Paenibacillus sp. NPDC093718 TaxID=3390601 RepID=UPI003D06FEEB
MQLYETMVNNQGVHIHVTEVHRDLRNEQTSLVVIPGLSESAEDYIAIMEKLSPRHIVIITLRGRGRSDSPASGYTLKDHISDIDAAIRHLELEHLVIMGYSRGVSYQLGYAVQNLIRGVKPHPGLSLEAVEQYKLALPQANIVAFEQHDHNIFEPDVDVFVRTADSFLKEIRKNYQSIT